ncbi:uncharacterized protein At5g39865-like [Macadamia integrifolia]|uniref:uncharacterized protein At5g39865-like n=1 Tax=Macadamia integrifolia TaxID=60698 RepID=UPI001C4F342C|nr:uncharacterized protein At5g39865-like [Macadamia integrifolia]
MGCTVPRPESVFTIKASTTTTTTTTTTFEAAAPSSSSSSSSTFPRFLSLPTPLVHHPPLKKGDTHLLVSLTSTTYTSLLLDQRSSDHHQKKTLTLESETHKNPSPDSVINAWGLMAGLDDFDFSSKPNSASLLDRSHSVRHDSSSPKKPFFSRSGLAKKLFGSFQPPWLENSNSNSNSNSVGEGKVKQLCNSFEPSADAGNDNNNSLMKPQGKQSSEESLLADMDPNLLSSCRRSMSSRQLSFNQSKTARSFMGSSSRFSPLFDSRIRLPGADDKIVVFFTSLRGIRRTYEDCSAVRNILRGFRVLVDERDISMDSNYRKELQTVLGEKTVSLPQVFICGKYIGGAEDIKQLHEVGELAKLLEGFPIRDTRFVCKSCGDARFVPCLNCSGSRKVFDEDEEQLRSCLVCNENGLIRCPSCNS